MNETTRAILVALNYKTDLNLTKISIEELKGLAHANRIKVVDTVIQSSDRIDPRFYIGSGKVNEIKRSVEILNIDVVIFDDTLSPAQIRNLESVLETQIIDRSFLILQIFAERAKTRQAMLEVSLAQKLYLLPRLIGMSKSLSRQGGGSFNAKGPGETKLELDRRKIHEEISQIKAELKEIKKTLEINRKQRIENEIPVVALVGYTNAGKSSLMNYFSEHYAQDKTLVFEENMLFATLDTKAKRIKINNYPPFILIDTVGFISKLPPELINSFESTLSDIQSAQLILHVIDGLNPTELEIQLTQQILKNLGILDTPRVLVVTKRDLRLYPPILKDDYLYVSSKTGEGMEELIQSIFSNIYKDSRIYKFIIPFQDMRIFDEIKNDITVLDMNYVENGLELRALIPQAIVRRIEKYFK
ncbi:GTPase HflX [Acholeplasma equifetale]|uniref:GTPase HflX n=1 Tax=Acholeplasma equifetale TaxID=264634 RepID=UPI0005527402|nr:GTPase HflX [Acholeplasma equifetale]